MPLMGVPAGGAPGPPGPQGPAGAAAGTFLSRNLNLWVDYANGSDANTGLSPSLPLKTIAAAYTALQAAATAAGYSDLGKGLGVGTILLLPGTHDVGTGLALSSSRPVKILGDRKGSVTHFPSDSAAKIVSSNSGCTELVKISHASAIGYGFWFEDISFIIDHTHASTTKCIYPIKVGDMMVRFCSFDGDDNSTNLTATAVYHEDSSGSSGEAGNVRVLNCNYSRMQLYQSAVTGGGNGGNFNKGLIQGNVGFYGGTLPSIHLNGNHNGCTISDNDLEGTAIGVQIGPNGIYTTNMFSNNNGEDDSVSVVNPFYNLSASVSQQIILGGECNTPQANTPGTWVNFGANAYRNLVVGVMDLVASNLAEKRFISETSNSDKNHLWLINTPMPAYTVTNPSTDRGLNVTADTTAQVAAVLGTLIADLQAQGLVK